MISDADVLRNHGTGSIAEDRGNTDPAGSLIANFEHFFSPPEMLLMKFVLTLQSCVLWASSRSRKAGFIPVNDL